MDCIWCESVKRCSNGYDRKRQEWLHNNCQNIEKNVCSANTSPSPSSTSPSSYPSTDTAGSGGFSGSSQLLTAEKALPNQRSSEGGAAFLTLFMLLALTSGVALWTFYAYKNPHTPSGQILIKYRPSNWRWQDAETRYTAASIHM